MSDPFPKVDLDLLEETAKSMDEEIKKGSGGWIHWSDPQTIRTAIAELVHLRKFYKQLAEDYVDLSEACEKMESWIEQLGPPDTWFPSLTFTSTESDDFVYKRAIMRLPYECRKLLKKAKEENNGK